MADALLEKTIVRINNSNTPEIFIASGEVIRFDGFLKVYIESSDNDEDEESKGLLPPLQESDPLEMERIDATEKYSQSPPGTPKQAW
jgi:DNA topoisomerase I